eukprot:GHVH01011381.1.p1 GENE.GHVH01011381.1~~GHVH01011381.1.p1  ORF type:complete len:326 (+),score=66.36 GHVH01011381.1:75-1052(+)
MKDLIVDLRQEVFKTDESLAKSIPQVSFALGSWDPAPTEGRHNDDVYSEQSSEDIEDVGEPFMLNFMQTMGLIRDAIARIQQYTEQLITQREALATAFNQDMEKEVQREVASINNELNQALRSVKQILECLDEDNKWFADNNPNSAEARIRTNLHTFISKKFKDVVMRFHAVQDEYKAELSNRMNRQVMMAMPSADPEEVAGMIERGEITGASDIIQVQLQGGVHQDMRTALGEIQDKYADVKKLEQNVAELNQMFQELGALVEANGDMIDLIEHNVGEAQDFMDKGTANIEKARKQQKKNAKKATFCAVAIAIAITIILLILFV